MNQPTFFTRLATLGPIGYMRAPGTLATMVTLPVVYYFRMVCSNYCYMGVLFLFLIIAFVSIEKSLMSFRGNHDPSEIVIDEAIGCFITFYSVPMNVSSLFLGVLLFRLFDIVKCFGIKKVEFFAGAWGVMLDDILAALLSNVLLHVINVYIC